MTVPERTVSPTLSAYVAFACVGLLAPIVIVCVLSFFRRGLSAFPAALVTGLVLLVDGSVRRVRTRREGKERT